MPKGIKGFQKGVPSWSKGKKLSKTVRKKMSESRKKLFKKGYVSPAKGKMKSIEHKGKIRKTLKKYFEENGFPESAKIKISKIHRRTNDRIMKEVVKLEKQGFKCIPITNVIPDIIAIKDDKVYAIEVEYGEPNYLKYNKNNYRNRFDDVIWLLRK